jgi:hypothetical protein
LVACHLAINNKATIQNITQPSGKSDAGKSYVVFGKADSSAINLSTIADANNSTRGFVINGEVVNDRSGYSVSQSLL